MKRIPPDQGADPYNAWKAAERELRIVKHESENKQKALIAHYNKVIADLKKNNKEFAKDAYRYFRAFKAAEEFMDDYKSTVETAEEMESFQAFVNIMSEIENE